MSKTPTSVVLHRTREMAPPAPAQGTLGASASASDTIQPAGLTSLVTHFAPAPALSPAQRAAATRAANKGATTSQPSLVTSTGLPAVRFGLRLWPSETYIRATVHVLGDGDAMGWPDTGIMLEAYVNERGDLDGFRQALTAGGSHMSLAEIERVAPMLRQANVAIARAFEESDDISFAQAAMAFCSQARASVIEVRDIKAIEPCTVKRGAIYITAHKLGEALQARNPVSPPAPAPEALAA